MNGNGRKKALITGITGQDGSYLTEFLLRRGYQVHGIFRRSSSFNRERVEHLMNIYDRHDESTLRVVGHYGDVTDAMGLREVLTRVLPHEVYNLAAQSHVRVSFDQPLYTVQAVAAGAVNMLEAIRDVQNQTGTQIKFYQASSSEMYGKVVEVPQSETTPFHPRSPYACAKAFAHWQTVNYREAYGMFAVNGILFNHESPRRGENFVTRKITRAATRIKEGLQDKLYLGNLDAKRDWGFAGDYVEAMWLMLQQDKPHDYVIATGETHSVKEFLHEVFEYLELNWEDYVVQDPKYLRPSEVDLLLGDASKARRVLGWGPRVGFAELARMMTEADWNLARRERVLCERGYGDRAVPDAAKMEFGETDAVV